MTTIAELVRARFGLETEAGAGWEADGGSATLAGLLNRRSSRRYTDEPVPDELLEVLLACAQSAPTKSNLQQYSIVVVSDPDQRRALAALCPDTGQLETCALFLVFCADLRRNRWIGGFRGRPNDNDNMDSFLNATVDAALVMQCFITAAESVGLGTACISEVRNRIGELSDVLGLPDGVFPISGLTAGWPAADGFINQRIPPSVAVHRDRYDDDALEAEIEAYDARRHDIFPIAPDKQRRVEEYGVAEYCPWSENAARQLSFPERPGFRDYLKGRGFALD
jgi:nitroreductase/FMN reductase [NAD(P)H]